MTTWNKSEIRDRKASERAYKESPSKEARELAEMVITRFGKKHDLTKLECSIVARAISLLRKPEE